MNITVCNGSVNKFGSRSLNRGQGIHFSQKMLTWNFRIFLKVLFVLYKLKVQLSFRILTFSSQILYRNQFYGFRQMYYLFNFISNEIFLPESVFIVINTWIRPFRLRIKKIVDNFAFNFIENVLKIFENWRTQKSQNFKFKHFITVKKGEIGQAMIVNNRPKSWSVIYQGPFVVSFAL